MQLPHKSGTEKNAPDYRESTSTCDIGNSE
jgi:hypothetical protein